MGAVHPRHIDSDEFRSVAAKSLDGFLVVGVTGDILEANDSYCCLMGYSRQEIIKRHISEIDAIESAEDVSKQIEELIKRGALRFQTRHIHKNGSFIDVEVSTTYSPTHGGTFYSFIRDITEHKRHLIALRQSEERYRNIVENQIEFVDRFLPGGILTYINDSLAKFVGMPSNDLLGKSFYPFMHENDREEMIRQIESISLENPIVENESRIVLPDGRMRWHRWTNTGIFDEHGNLCEYQAVGRDITERKQAEMDLKHSHDLMSYVIQHNQSALAVHDKDMRYVYVSQRYIDDYRVKDTDIIGKHHYDVFPDLPQKWRDVHKRALAGEVCSEQEDSYEREDGTVDWTRWECRPWFEADGTIGGIIIHTEVITERKRVEIALRKSEENFRTIIDVSPVPLAMNDEQGNITFLNKAFVQAIGYNLSDIPTLEEWWTCAYPDLHYHRTVADNWMSNLEEAKRTNSSFVPLEVNVVCKDNSVRTFICSATSIENGFAGNHLVVLFDITDRKKAEEEKLTFEHQLQHTQKLESLGVLSGGIAHDFNNILAIIMGYCALTKMDYETAENNIFEIEKAAERAAELCRQMLAYAGKAQLTKTRINISMLVDEMVTMLKSTLPQNAAIKPELATNIPFIVADASQLRQVVMNLIINASEAIGDGHGEIQVSLAATAIRTGQSEQDYNGNKIPPGEYVCFEVADNGCGMNEETKWRIFEPFYTTKFTGRGLGMSAVLGIIKSHGGALQLHSQLGQGTSFKVYLPVPKKYSNEVDGQQQSISSAPWQGSGTILLVEDEDQVRHIAKALLKNFGFTVLEAVDGKEALELYQKNATDIRLVMTDMGMPIMDGYELFAELKKLNPELPIIVSSGYGDAEVGSRLCIENIAGLISKPYGPDQLREVLKRAMEV